MNSECIRVCVRMRPKLANEDEEVWFLNPKTSNIFTNFENKLNLSC
jgi:hypothetical protein